MRWRRIIISRSKSARPKQSRATWPTSTWPNSGSSEDSLAPVVRAPHKRQELWQSLGVTPRGIDREVVEALHRTHIGDDQEAGHILSHAIRTALADGWGGSMIATDISDILFGTPAPVIGQANLGVLKEIW